MTDGSTGGPSGPVRTIVLGSGRFALPMLGRLAAHPAVDVVAVVTVPPRPVGRAHVLTPTPVETQARELGLAVLTPARLRAPAALDEILAMEPTLAVLADYGQIVPSEILDLPHGALNLHPSLLPRHRGATPIPATILAGDTETGVSLIRMDQGIDTGPLIAQEQATLAGDETAPALEARLAIAAAGLLARSLEPWLAGELVATPQPETGATMTRSLRRADGRLDPGRDAEHLARQVRAHLPWPGSFHELPHGGRLVILSADPAPSEPSDQPGRLVRTPDAGLALTTADGRLVLHDVQPSGGRPMTGEAFVRGHAELLAP